MRFWLYMTIAMLALSGALLETGCECGIKTIGGGKVQPFKGVRYSKPMPYKGRADATTVYHEEIEPEMGRVNQGGCTTGGCNYWLLAAIHVHNPTDSMVKVTVGYTWYIDKNYKAGSNEMTGVPVPPHKTVLVELQQQFEATQNISRSVTGESTLKTSQAP